MKKPLWLGSALIGLMLPIHFLVPIELSVQIAAVTLGVIGGAYIGFAAVNGSRKALITELIGSALFGAAAVIGLAVWPLVIPLGILLHAAWDVAHHKSKIGAPVPHWYIPFCVIVDVVVGAALLWMYWTL